MLEIEIINKSTSPFSLTPQQTKGVAAETLSALGVEKNLILEIELVDKEEIQVLNRQYRAIDKPTDVLSFPQAQSETGAVELLGTLVICEEIVSAKGEKMTDVIKHGILHLVGFDHETDEEKWNKAAEKVNCQL